jgi:hypothetical protein
MSNKPSSYGMGSSGTIGTAGQTVATTKCSVGTSFRNKYGDRYVAIKVSSTQAYTLYVLGYDSSFSSTADGSVTGQQLTAVSGNSANAATTAPNGYTHYVRIAGCSYILPMVQQSSGSSATVTITYQTFND